MPHTPWSLILAAGRGRRLASVTGGLPKQFWAPRGERTLLEHTVDRIADLSPQARIVTVVDRSQRRYAEAINSRTPIGRLAYQAGDRGTAAGVLRGLVEVTADPDALVVLTPSDHGVAQPGVFRQGLRDAAGYIRSDTAGDRAPGGTARLARWRFRLDRARRLPFAPGPAGTRRRLRRETARLGRAGFVCRWRSVEHAW